MFLTLVVIAIEQKLIVVPVVFDREIIVVAELRLEVGVTRDEPDAGKIIVIVFLLERRRAEAHGIAEAHVEALEWCVANADLWREAAQ